MGSLSTEMNDDARFGDGWKDGLHGWTDSFGNSGTELLSQHHITLHVTPMDGLFVPGRERAANGLAEHFNSPGDLKRKVFVVVDMSLPQSRQAQIQDYFLRCKMQHLVDAYSILPFAPHQTERTLEKAIAVVSAAKHFGLRRKDLLIAIGGVVVTEAVGFAAALYRRSTPYISIPTDPVGILRCHDGHHKVSLDHVDDHGRLFKGLFALPHLPIAVFYDLSFSDSWPRTLVTRGLADIIKTAVVNDKAMFSYIEAHIDEVSANTENGHLEAAIELTVNAISKNLSNNVHLSRPRLDAAATHALEQIQGITYGDAPSMLMGIALASTLSFVKGKSSGTDLRRILHVLDKAGLPTCDVKLEPELLWKHTTTVIQEWYGDGEIMIPAALGKETSLNLADISPSDVATAMAIVRERAAEFYDKPRQPDTIVWKAETSSHSGSLHEWTTSEEVRYHVANVQEGMFKTDNPTILQNYCVDNTTGRKMKILVVMDDYPGNALPDVRDYFECHRAAIDRFSILPLHITTTCKTTESVLKVVKAALDLQLSPEDLFIAVGGGTLMDIVGFAAAFYKGGTRYLKIPTTLVGMIDAGIAVKVGVNLGNHKNMIGSYFAPVGCLNAPGTFLATLPRRELACGLAEALKMAVIKSPRLFEIIARHRLDFNNHAYALELIQISVYTMLEELQPNLREDNLKRIVDFGHEFGHIIEGLARHETPHGECVAVGIGIATYIAYLKGIVSQIDLDKIFYLMLDTELPIYLTPYDCCDPAVLWAKICTDGIEHKNGMLYLVVPETIGRARFLDHISDINAGMITESIHVLKRYAEWYGGRGPLQTDGNLLHSSEIDTSVGIPPPRTAAVIGASGDIGSMLADYLVQNDVQVICSIRPPSLNKFRTRTQFADPRTRVLTGDVFDLVNLRAMIQEVDVVYNLAGIVTLGAQPHDFPKVLAINGFAQGIITHLIQQSGRDGNVKVIFPSTQRVHLTSGNKVVGMWVQKAAEAFAACKDDLLSHHQDIYTKLEQFASDLISVHPLPTGYNVYEISKRLGEHFVSSLSRYSSVRISGVYGPTFTRGFMSRAISPTSGVNSEAGEKRDFIYIDDVSELLFKAAQTDAADSKVFDAASGESIDLQDVWRMVRELKGDHAEVVFKNANDAKEEMQPDPTIARRLLGRDLVSMRVGLQKTIDGHLQPTTNGHLPPTTNGQLQPTTNGHLRPATNGHLQPTTNGHHPEPKLREATRPYALQPTTNGHHPEPKLPEATKLETRSDQMTRLGKPHVIAIDIGATYFRTGVLGPDGLFLHEPARSLTPSKQSYPQESLVELQERLMETLACDIASTRRRYASLLLEEVAISLGAVVTSAGIVKDASILWGDAARGFDFKHALEERVPGVRLTVLNDISAAAWRYKDEGRFCLITVSSGLSNKVFNPDLCTPDQLDLDTAGIGGEMGHVLVNPHQVDALTLKAIAEATLHSEEFAPSKLSLYVSGDAQKINARHLGKAAKENDSFALRLLEEADVPMCPCGNLADLCSYSSGRGALRYARTLAARGGFEVAANEISDAWLQQAISTGHPLALKVLYHATYPLALRILQLAADIGIDKFIIVGGFALKTGGSAYLQALQDHLVRFYHNSAYFADWTETQIRTLVKGGLADDNDGLIGMCHYVHRLRSQYHAIEKDVGEPSQRLITRSIPRCGARQILTKVVYAGICTTDLQILRAERGLEPTVLGHEGVCQVLEVGKDVKGVSVGSVVVLNPNNPLDEHDKLGHTVEGVFQEYFKFGQEQVDKNQVLVLDGSQAHATDTLVEPLSCVVAAQERMKDRIAGKNVLVVGAGVMGLMFVQTSVKYGARHVFLANRSREKLDFAVAKGIAQPDNVFVIGESISSQIPQVTGDEGVDIVVICVSMGQGVRAAQDAANYINADGCVYLFAGFRPGDVMVMDGGVTVDAWAIRSGWKTERIEVAGKPLDVSGHRGSEHQDLEIAVDLIRGDPLSFSRVISHVVSLDALPDIAESLTRGEDILGRPAKRVIIDMEARDRTVQFAEYFPLRLLQEAARRPKDLISRGNLFRDIGFDGESSMLGWVIPPTWQQIKAVLDPALHMKSLTMKRNFIFCGTGGWAFLVDALRDIMPATSDNTDEHNVTIHTLSSLDPQALLNLFSCMDDDLEAAVCIGISQSGTTMETVMLMNAVRERFDRAGLDYREHFIWLTDMNQSSDDDRSGEAVIRASKDHDWKDVSMVPLTVGNHADINALFCAPHSTLAFLTMALLRLGDTEAVQHMYQQYLALRDEVSRHVIPQADHVASKYIEDFRVDLDDIVAPATARLITQLIAQSLGSKQAGFNPRIQIAPGDHTIGGFETIKLPIPAETPAPVKAMLAMYALSVFVAMVAYHRNITFVTHPKVDLYKRKAKDLVAAPEIKHSAASPSGLIGDQIVGYLDQHPQTRFVDIVCYWEVSPPHRQGVRDWLVSCLGSRTSEIHVDVVPGADWNHSRFQRSVQAKDTLYVILEQQEYQTKVEGISEQTILNHVSMLRAIARATYETLAEKALYFVFDKVYFQEVVT